MSGAMSVGDVEMTSHNHNNIASGSGNDGSDGVRVSGSAIDLSKSRAGKLRRETKLPIHFVIERLRLAIEHSALTTEFAFFVPFLVVFILYFVTSRPVEENFYIVNAIYNSMTRPQFPIIPWQVEQYQNEIITGSRLWVELDKGYGDIGNANDIRNYINGELMWNTWTCAGDPNAKYDFLAPYGQSYYLGAMRIRTQQVTPTSCSLDPDIAPTNASAMPPNCYAPLTSSTELTGGVVCNATSPINPNITLFPYFSCAQVPGIPISASEGVYHCGGYMAELPFSASCNDVLAVQAIMDQDCFINTWSTRFTAFEWFAYTPSSDSFHSIKLFVETLAPGNWLPQWQLRSFQVFSTASVGFVVLEAVFLAYVLFWIFRFFWELVSAVRDPDQNVIAFLTDFWTLLEIVNLLVFIGMFAVQWSWISVSGQAAASLKLPMGPRYPQYLDRIQVLYEAMGYGGAVNTVLIFLKLLKYVRLNAQLSVLTRTLASCQQSILGVLVIFITVILGYGLTAWNLFGINLPQFRNLGVAMSSLVRMLVGDIDYESMRQENRFLAGLFFWTYLILALFLLLNFLIAVISESFARTSGKAFSQPLDELLIRTWQHAKAFFKPSNISRMLRNSLSGKSEATLLRAVVDKLDAAMKQKLLLKAQARVDRLVAAQTESEKIIAEDDDSPDDVDIVMQYDDIVLWVDPDTYGSLTEHFFVYTWDDLMNSYDDAKKGSEESEKRQMAETVEAVVMKVLGDDIARVDQLDDLISSIEVELTQLMSIMRIPDDSD